MDYLTNDTELTAVADAIREKSETTDPLEWPEGFIQAIEDCQTGGPELEWLWGNQITDTMSGTIDSTDDAYEGPILSLGVDGVSTQVTMTGKNLLPNDRFCRTYYNPAEGTTFNPNAAGNGTVVDNGDGTFTMTAPSGWTGVSFYSEILPAGNYYFKASFTGSAVRASVGYVDASTMTTVGAAYNTTVSTTITRNWTFESSVIVYMSVSSASAGTVTITRPQLELGSTATAYEPYTGGKPSPNPDYPQEIVSVDDLALEVHGKNLFDIATARFSGNAVYPVVKTETGITVTAGAETGWAYDVTSVDIFDEQTVTLSTTPSTTTPLILASGYDANNAITVSKQVRANTVTVSLPSGTVRLTLYFYARQTASGAVGDTCTYNDIQLELGTTATDYEPYQGQTIPLYDGTLRSLPDGTKDELHLAYLKPSKDHEGWAWYEREVVKAVERIDLGTLSWNKYTQDNTFFATISGIHRIYGGALCTAYKQKRGGVDSLTSGEFSLSSGGVNSVWFRNDSYTIATDFMASVSGVYFDYLLATPIVTELDPIELPIMPSENATVWCDGGSAQPTFVLEYIQNANIVISRLEDSIADLATS